MNTLSLSRRRRHRSRRLTLQRLEPRQLLFASAILDDGVLRIDADNGGSDVEVANRGADVAVISHQYGWHYELTRAPARQVDRIFFSGGSGADKFVNNTSIPSDAYGRAGHDQLIGGSRTDRLHGGDGNDRLNGRDGVDHIWGNRHNDIIWGGGGDDWLYGGDGNDNVNGGSGHDHVEGNQGADRLNGDTGNDRLFGGWGNDILRGHSGDDLLRGEGNADTLEGGDGLDRLYGGEGDDTLRGQRGDDQLFGQGGADLLDGGDQHDRLYGGDGADVLNGGNGRDSLYGGNGDDRLTGGAGADRFLRVFDGTFASLFSDLPLDATSIDVTIPFVNGAAENVQLGNQLIAAAPAIWADPEIVTMDAALANLVELTASNTLLRTADGRVISFVRQGQLRDLDSTGRLGAINTGYLGWNSGGGRISLADNGFIAAEPVAQTIYHEIGHNWDEKAENSQFLEFYQVAGWAPVALLEYQGVDFERATGDGWENLAFIDRDSGLDGFARGYGKTNPLEDFATSFAAYVMAESGADYVGNTIESPAAISRRMSERFTVLDDVFASLA